jgi:hypothetical protein
MPLYVEGDLDDEKSRAVAVHLYEEECPQCNALKDELGESRRWIRSCAAPDFDEAFFNDLRGSVLADIESNEGRAGFFQLLRERSRWKPALAATIALMILAGAMLYIYSGRAKNDSSELVAEEEKKEENLTVTIPEEKKPGKPGVRRKRTRQTSAIIAETKKTIEPSLESQFVSENFEEERAMTPAGMTRIEFQTADPTIRIIWFAPKETESKSSKQGTD